MPRKKSKKISQFVNNQFDFILCVTVLLLLALGIIMVLSASSPSALSKTESSYTYVQRQLLFGVAGIGIMAFASKIDYRFYKKFYKIGYVVGLALLITVSAVGSGAKGATRWIDLGFTTFQPSELVKVFLILFYAVYLTNKKEKIRTFKSFIINYTLILPFFIILVIFQRHLSATIIIFAITTIMMLAAGTKISHFFIILPFVLALLAVVIFGGESIGGEFRAARVFSFLNPLEDSLGTGWQATQSLYAIGSRRFIRSRSSEKALKNIYTYQSLIMILYFQL